MLSRFQRRAVTNTNLVIGGRRLLQSLSSSDQSEKKAWQAQDNINIQRVTQKAIIHELTQEQTQTINSVVPWFLDNMPSCYFRQVTEKFRMEHIKAISAIRDAKMDLHMNLKARLPDGRLVLTFIRPGKKGGRLVDLVKLLPRNDNLFLSRVQSFMSKDKSLSLSLFIYGDEKKCSPNDIEKAGAHILNYAKILQGQDLDNDTNVPEISAMFEPEALLNYFGNCSESYIIQSDPRRFLNQRKLLARVSGTEDMEMSIEKANAEDSNGYWVDIAVPNTLPQIFFENTSRLLQKHNFEVSRSHLDIVEDGDNGNVCFLRILVVQNDSSESFPIEELQSLTHELKRTKWLDPVTMDLMFNRYPLLEKRSGELITAFCSLLHPLMTEKDPFIFSKANILEIITEPSGMKYAERIASLFLEKFEPSNPILPEAFSTKFKDISSEIQQGVEDKVEKQLLLKMLDIVDHTLKTNIYLPDRYSLGLRLDSKLMSTEESEDEIPYGVFFIHGRRFNAFHVRFRDIARGGMRLVTPASLEQHALESSRHYKECYGLAFAQQLKNKDIPEGGSKAVILINCDDLSEERKNFVMRKSVKAFTDTLLDLVLDTDETRSKVVDLLGKKEVLYLGPDEQVTVEDINWVIKRASRRGYETPDAFMSSKPRSGINHKEFGVTSEGVNVFLESALFHILNINPRNESFTIKMTGGPDGDVAGNEIKILSREYGKNAKIVGIADHSGCAEDPNGLDQTELLRLVSNGLSISNFDRQMLGDGGVVHLVDTDEGVKARNSMHNRLEADAFVPAGGRPNTIDIHNYKKFLLEDGSPSSPLIVEGANLFITEEARQALFEEAGVAIVKDSSANKCGVITSSYEICAAMILSKEEFVENKNQIVTEIIEKLQFLAKLEANLLFHEFQNYSDSLPHRSKAISNAINSTTDALSNALSTMSNSDQEELMPLFYDHLPKTLAELGFDRVNQKVPEQYIKNAIASSLASKIVYKEGTSYIESLPKAKVAMIALKYIAKEKEIAKLTYALRDADMPNAEKEAIIAILDAGGVRTALRE